MSKGCIYKFTNKVNGKIYIGKTIDWKRRMCKHKSSAKKPKHYFGRALRKYGFDNFEIEILIDNIPEEKLNELEIEYIRVHKSNNSKFGYNLTLGGEGCSGYKRTAEQLKRITKNHNVSGGGSVYFCNEDQKWLVRGKSPEIKFVGRYFTKKKAEVALALYNTTGKIMPSDIKTRKNGTGSIYKTKDGRFVVKSRQPQKHIGTFDTKAKAEKAMALYNTTGKCMQSDTKIRKRGTGCIIKTRGGRFQAVFKKKNIGTFDTYEQADEALGKIWCIIETSRGVRFQVVYKKKNIGTFDTYEQAAAFEKIWRGSNIAS